MRRPTRTTAALAAVVVLSFSGRSFGDEPKKTTLSAIGTNPPQMDETKIQIGFLTQRLKELEQKLTALQGQLAAAHVEYAAHTHTYRGDRCDEYMALSNLKYALDHVESWTGKGICLIHPDPNHAPDHSSKPEK